MIVTKEHHLQHYSFSSGRIVYRVNACLGCQMSYKPDVSILEVLLYRPTLVPAPHSIQRYCAIAASRWSITCLNASISLWLQGICCGGHKQT